MADVKVTILVLDYMKGEKVVENVKSILAQSKDFSVKIFVIDNSDNKKNAEILKQLDGLDNVFLQINKKNIGYPKAHNFFNKEIEGDYVMIVNPDILWKEKDAIKKMVDFMDNHQNIGVLGPKQINQDGSIAMTVRAFPKLYLQIARRTFLRKLPWLKQRVAYDEMKDLDYNKIQDVDWLQSSCVIIRRDLWEKTGGLSEDYFLFMSDVEICFDAWKNNLRVVYYPETVVYADGIRLSNGGFKKFFQSWVLRQHLVDSFKYRLKHCFDKNPRQEYYKNKK